MIVESSIVKREHVWSRLAPSRAPKLWKTTWWSISRSMGTCLPFALTTSTSMRVTNPSIFGSGASKSTSVCLTSYPATLIGP